MRFIYSTFLHAYAVTAILCTHVQCQRLSACMCSANDLLHACAVPTTLCLYYPKEDRDNGIGAF